MVKGIKVRTVAVITIKARFITFFDSTTLFIIIIIEMSNYADPFDAFMDYDDFDVSMDKSLDGSM